MITQVRLHVHNSRKHFPWSAQKCWKAGFVGLKVQGGSGLASMDRHARVLIRILAILGRNSDLLLGHRFTSPHSTILEHNSCIAEYEIYCSIYITLPIKLTLRVYIESVLVSFYLTTIDDSMVCAYTKGYSLVVLWPSLVYECNVSNYKPSASSSYNITM